MPKKSDINLKVINVSREDRRLSHSEILDLLTGYGLIRDFLMKLLMIVPQSVDSKA